MFVSYFYYAVCCNGSYGTVAKKRIRVAVYHIESIKPILLNELARESLKEAGFGLILDDDYKDGVGKCIALDLSNDTGAKLEVLGLDDRTAGFDKKVDNLPPDKYAIEKKVIEILERKLMIHSKYPLMRNNILREDLDAVIDYLRTDDPMLTNGKKWSSLRGIGRVGWELSILFLSTPDPRLIY